MTASLPVNERKENVHGREAPEAYKLTVRQPEQVKDLIKLLEILEGVTEAVGVQPPGASAGSVAGMQGDDAGDRSSLREQALAHLPDTPVMQRKLISSLEHEVSHLKRQARRAALKMRRGGACALNEIYAKIRKIKVMIAEILEATREIVERLYVRLFIDGQPIV